LVKGVLLNIRLCSTIIS